LLAIREIYRLLESFDPDLEDFVSVWSHIHEISLATTLRPTVVLVTRISLSTADLKALLRETFVRLRTGALVLNSR
jgi:hypothetical protein